MALLSTTEAAKFLGYAEYTLRTSRATGSLGGHQSPPFVRIGTRTIRYKEEDLSAWIEGLESGVLPEVKREA